MSGQRSYVSVGLFVPIGNQFLLHVWLDPNSRRFVLAGPR
jgi:hypothetical protein